MSKQKTKPIIELKDTSVFFGQDQNKITALANISLKIFPREFVVIMGQSGSGKTTLMNIIGLLLKPSLGKYLLRGEQVYQLKREKIIKIRAKKMGFIFQKYNLVPHLNVWENVMLPGLFTHSQRNSRKKRAIELLQRVKMADQSHQLVNELSGGEQQRVAIARAMMLNPWIILADEPTGNLDTKTAKEVMEIIKNLNRVSRRTIIMVTHNPNLASYATRKISIKDGKVTNDQAME